MDRDVPARLTYWTGIWEPGREALSNEVDLLRRSLAPNAPVVSFSAGQRSEWWPRDRAIRLSGRRIAPLWALATVLEPLSEFSHVVGALDAWHLLRVLGRRPVLFTAAIEGPTLGPALYDKVSYFAAESQPLADALVRAGVPAGRVEIVYPGVDLARFHPAPRADAPFRILFASSPASPADVERRGIPLIIEAARRCPEVELVLLWRRWGNVEACVRAIERIGVPPNVQIDLRDVSDMAAVFRSVHATIFLPVPGHGKSAPNSVIEGLASGCAAIVSGSCGLAGVVRAHAAGVVVDHPDPQSVADAMREASRGRSEFARNARALAERYFSDRLFLQRYRDLYDRTARRTGRAAAEQPAA
jgi:glycosyltransferase involved in cell wall biosynthesis